MTPKRVLQCHSGFSPGGKELRTATLINAFGAAATHMLWTAHGAPREAAHAIRPEVDIAFASDAPAINGRPSLSRYRAIAQYLQKFDLVLTYNWGAMDVVAARRLFPAGTPPLIHHEDGFNEDEAHRLSLRRNMFRRWMLAGADQIIVPSQSLCGIARDQWGQGAGRVTLIPNGVDLVHFHPRDRHSSSKRVTICAVGGLRPVKNFARLIRAFATLPANARLVIFGEGPDREALAALAQSLGMADRISLPGHRADLTSALRSADVFALASDTEQAPLSVIEAMASGLPILSTDVGDVRAMVAPENQRFIVPLADDQAYQRGLAELVADADLASALGRANRLRAEAQFDMRQMVRLYAHVYALPDPTACSAVLA